MAEEGSPPLNHTPAPSSAPVHPWAWWCWALTVAAAISLTTNPLCLGLLLVAVIAVVLVRRGDAPWAGSLRSYLILALVVVGIRLIFQVVVGAPIGQTVLFRLPEVPLPDWAQGIRLGGEVTAEALLATTYDALRLAAMLICLGAANSLANPRQALRSVPAALYEASVAVVIALSVVPQLIESGRRISRARRLRGHGGRGWQVASLLLPVLTDAVDRSIELAAGMEARGFARTADTRHRRRLLVAMLGSSVLLMFGAFRLLSGSPDDGVPVLLIGAVGALIGLRNSGRRLGVSRYRPQPWSSRDTLIGASGAATLAVLLLLDRLTPGLLQEPIEPLAWPTLDPLMVVAAGLASLPIAFAAPGPTPAEAALIEATAPDPERARARLVVAR